MMARQKLTVSNIMPFQIGNIKANTIGSQFRFLVKQPAEKQPAFPNIGVPYSWHRLGFSTHWKPSHSVVLCFDLPISFKSSLMAVLPASSGRLCLNNPISFHNVLMGEVVELYNTALWSWRDLIRDMEKVWIARQWNGRSWADRSRTELLKKTLSQIMYWCMKWPGTPSIHQKC